ncbi:MAG: hypothetical protein ACKVOX_05725 [Rhizobacter sp.]
MKSTGFTKSLVLVVGAGASKEVDLPLGAELKGAIATALDIRYENGHRRVSGDGLIDEAFRTLARSLPAPRTNDINPFLHSSRHIAGAMPQALSIDNFIESHRGDESIALCGKLAIVRAILDAEKRSKLYVDRRKSYNTLNFADVEATWFNAFFQLVTENCHKDEIAARLSQVAIVTFNYDRCIEHYLHASLQNYYRMSADESTKALESLNIYHPYGTVGQLEWQSPKAGIAFGGELDAQKLIQLAGGIRTFTEGIDPKLGESNAIRTALSHARRIAFLGFAFHRLNLELLFDGGPFESDARDCPVYATSLGLSKADVEVIALQLAKLGNFRHDSFRLLNQLRCSELLREYWRSLSLS